MSRLDEFNRKIAKKNLVGFWTNPNARDVPREPRSSFEPYLWNWNDVHEALVEAAEVVDKENALRRTISFSNPTLQHGAAHTLLISAQIVNPGEIARAHRHTMGAIRFVLKGGGARTTVEGEPFPMERGDFITTPGLTWHDHFNGSSEPVIWLDGADGPLIWLLQVGFSEPYKELQQAVTKPAANSVYELGPVRGNWVSSNSVQPPPYRYPWQETEKALTVLGERPGDPFDGILLRYVNPLTGGPTLPTMSCEIQMLRPGEQTKSHRHTSTAIYHVFKGKGFTIIDDTRYEWGTGDTFVVPLWRWHHHGSQSSESAVLFVMNDKPVMDALSLYREEGAV